MHANNEESGDQFEDIGEEFTTYAKIPSFSPAHEKAKKAFSSNKQQAPKLRMLKLDTNALNIGSLLGKYRKEQRTISSNGKCILVGNAIFKANFQSGNINSVVQIGKNAYEITLQKQLNSERLSSWFYFSCEGVKGQTKFVIKGFTKSSSLYSEGMKICYRQVYNGNKWNRGCSKICYCQSQREETEKSNYQLHFRFFFRNQLPNAVEFAYCFPYTYTNLLQFLTTAEEKIKITTLGKTFEGRQIPLLTIGNQNSKEAIIISARVHPGETVGSLMMEGFLSELIDDHPHSVSLRETFLFKIIPMINPDGVIHGNYRFSAAGYDLNRKWKSCRKKYHPEVYYFKDFIRTFKNQKQIIMFIDMHGHSRQKNVFFYGCSPKVENTKPKQFPFLMSKLHSPFRYEYCCYKMQKDKEGTARITVWEELKIDNVYTLQCSFCGNSGGPNYSQKDYQRIGRKLCYGICVNFWQLISKKEKKSSEEKSQVFCEQFKKNMDEFFQNRGIKQIQYDAKSSDSEPQAGQIPEEGRAYDIEKEKGQKLSKTSIKDQIRFHDEKRLNIRKSKIYKTQNESQIQFKKIKKYEELKMMKPYTRVQERIKTAKKSEEEQNTSSNLLNQSFGGGISNLSKMDHLKIISDSFQQKYKSESLRNEPKYKRKVINYEGKIRKVKKIAEEHKRRHFSAKHNQEERDFVLFQGLVGTNGLLEISKMNRREEIYPSHKTQEQSKKNIELYFRRQIKASEYTNKRRNQEMQVLCEGKKLHS